jgi:hypothetical protein
MLDSGCGMFHDQAMAEQWIIQVEGKEYGPADLDTLREWKADGRVLPGNPARQVDVDEANWKTAADIPDLFPIEAPPVQLRAAPVSESKPPRRNILVETFRIYFRGFFQFFCLSLLSIVPILCAEFTSRFINAATGVNVDLRSQVAGAFWLCMMVLWLVLIPVYIAGIQILTAELASGHRIGFLSVLNGAVKYWPRVAGLCVFVYGAFILLTGLGFVAVAIMLAGAAASSLVIIIVALGLATFQIWLFCRFFIFVLFWQQFSVLENLSAFHALHESSKLAHSGRDLPWYQRPLWRGALVFSVWIAFAFAIAIAAMWPRLTAEWTVYQDAFYQLSAAKDPEVVLQKMMASLPKDQMASFTQLSLNVLQRILQPLLGIAFVVLYLDSKGDDHP